MGELGLDWLAPKEPSKNRLDEWFLQSGRQTAAPQKLAPFFPEVYGEISLSLQTPHSAWTHARETSFLSSFNEADCWCYEKLLPLSKPLWPTSALQQPSKSCQTTANITEKAFVAAVQVASDRHASTASSTHRKESVVRPKTSRRFPKQMGPHSSKLPTESLSFS